MGDSEQQGLGRRELEDGYLRLRKPIYNVVFRRLWDAREADEVVQETFLRIWARREKVRPEGLEPLAWRTALNLASNRRRSRRLWKWVPLAGSRDSAASDDPETQAISGQDLEVLRTVIDSLPEKMRRVVLLTELSEMSYEEVGEILGIPAGTVGSRRSRAMKIMREKLENMTGGRR